MKSLLNTANSYAFSRPYTSLRRQNVIFGWIHLVFLVAGLWGWSTSSLAQVSGSALTSAECLNYSLLLGEISGDNSYTEVFKNGSTTPFCNLSGGGGEGMAADNNTHLLYIGVASKNRIKVYNYATGIFGTDIVLPSGLSPAEVILSSDGAYLYVGVYDGIEKISTATKTVVATYPLTKFVNSAQPWIWGLAIHPVTGNLYASTNWGDTHSGASTIEYLSPGFSGNTSLLATAPSGYYYRGIVFDKLGDLWAVMSSQSGPDRIVKYNGTTGAIISSYSFPTPTVNGGVTNGNVNAFDLSWGPDGNLYIATGKGDCVTKFDITTNTFSTYLPYKPATFAKTIAFICGDFICPSACIRPILTAGNIVCSGTAYSVSFYSSTSNVTASAGTVSNGMVTGIPVGTNVTLTATHSAGCSTQLTLRSPASCVSNPGCVMPSLIVGQPVCFGNGTYSVNFYNDQGTVSVNAGTVSGYSVVNIPVGTDLLLTATFGACVSQSRVMSPANCSNVCENPGISISGSICDASPDTTYHLNYVLSPGATLVSSAGTVGTGQITGIPAGINKVTLTVKVAGCSDRSISLPPVYCTPPPVNLHLKKLVSSKQAKVGDVLEYTIKVWNEASTPATGVIVRDSLNAGVQYVSSSASRGTYSPSTNQWIIGTIGANGETAILKIQVKVLSAGVWFNTAEITKINEGDVDSTPGNGKEGENDMDHACFTVPIGLCSGEKVQASVPSQYTDVQWFKNGGNTPIASGNVVLLSEAGIFTYTALNNVCPAQGCCPIIIEAGSNCCPVTICVPVIIKKKKK